MLDKFDIRIPFKAEAVHILTSTSAEEASDPFSMAGHVDPLKYDFLCIERFYSVDGTRQVLTLDSQKWDSISSGISGMAVGFYPRGCGLHQWPTISIKASPAKILQGHNVFGSECPKQGITQMLSYLQMSFPKIYADLDIKKAEIRYIDCTYSARIPPFFATKIYKMFECLATARTKVNSRYIDDGYIQLGCDSERTRAKIYRKLQELLDDLKSAIKSKDSHRVNVLSDQRLQDFAINLERFEATLGFRKLVDLGVPTNLFEFIRFNDWFLQVHGQPLCQHLWHLVFDPLFAQFEGHTMKNVDDTHIKLKIDAKFTRIKDDGKICKRLANAVYKTYQDIKREGFETLRQSRNATFRRNIIFLEEAGISRAFLKSLDPHKPFDNVIQMVQFVKVDFGQQRPDWYVEPKAGFQQPERHLRLVG